MLIDKAVYVSKVGKLIKAAVKSDKPDTKFSWCLTKIITSSPLTSQQSAVSYWQGMIFTNKICLIYVHTYCTTVVSFDQWLAINVTCQPTKI